MTFLESLIGRYKMHQAAIEEIQNRAVADAQRAFTPAELTEIEQHGKAAEALAPQIESARAEQTRNAKVNEAQADVAASTGAAAAQQAADQNAGQAGSQGTEQGRSGGQAGQGGNAGPGVQVGTSSTTAVDREPAHYQRANSQRFGFFADQIRCAQGDHDARQRMQEHVRAVSNDRALSTGVAGAGLVLPKWLTEHFEHIARQGRVVVAAVQNIDLGNDPSPLTIPKQTSGTDAVVAEISTQNTHPSETDGYATSTDVVTPKATSGIQVVSREMMDSTSPAVDQLIFADLYAVYNRKCEDKVCAALAAAAGSTTAVATFATEAAFNGTAPAVPAEDAVVSGAIGVLDARKLPATAIAMRTSRWGKYMKLRDTTGRLYFPLSSAGPMNVDGVGSVQAAGSIQGLPVLATDGQGIGGGYTEDILVFRASDTLFFEGSLMRFSYEEVAGPESVKLGIWAYTAVSVRQAANCVRRIRITAA